MEQALTKGLHGALKKAEDRLTKERRPGAGPRRSNFSLASVFRYQQDRDFCAVRSRIQNDYLEANDSSVLKNRAGQGARAADDQKELSIAGGSTEAAGGDRRPTSALALSAATPNERQGEDTSN